MVSENEQAGGPRSLLGDLVVVSTTQVNPQDNRELVYNYVALENIESGTGRLVNFEPVSGGTIESGKYAFEKGDLLYGRLRPYLRKVIIAPFDGICATEIIPLRPLNGVDPEFLREFLLSPYVARHVERLVAGARMPRLRVSDLLEIPVPLHGNAKRTSAGLMLLSLRYRLRHWRKKLDTAFAKIEQVKATVLSRIELGQWLNDVSPRKSTGNELLTSLLDQRRQVWEAYEQQRLTSSGSLLLDDSWKQRYPEPLPYLGTERLPSLPEHWVWASLSQLSSAVSPTGYGVVQPGEEPELGVNLIRVQDLKNGTIDTSQLRKISPEVSAAYPRSVLQGGEILVSLVGTIGKTAAVSPELTGANIARALAKITPTSEIVRNWLLICLNTPRMQEWMNSGAREVARKTLNISSLERAPIPIGPYADLLLLIQIASRLDGNVHTIRGKIAHGQAMVQRAEELWQDRVVAGYRVNFRDNEGWVDRARRWVNTPEKRDRSMVQGRRVTAAPRMGSKAADNHQVKNLVDVVKEKGGKISPLELLIAAGYGLEEIEKFYSTLAADVDSNRLQEVRPDKMSSSIELP